MNQGKLIGVIIGIVIGLVLLLNTFSWVTLEGNELAVRQHLVNGVIDETWDSGTHFYLGWLWKIYKYDVGMQKITFDDNKANSDSEYPRIMVNIGENGGQRAYIAISVNYRLDPASVVSIHKQGLGNGRYESVVLRREIVDIVNEIARPYPSALEIFSGKGFVEFKIRIEKELKNNAVLKNAGIDIENTIVYSVHLDPQYEAEIAAKQIAMQQVLRKQEETKAASEEAKRIFALSQAEVEKARQIAEAAKITQVTAAQACAEQEVLKANAEKQKRTLEAEGERDANLALASGVVAVGEAEAKVSALKRESLYAGESGARRAQVEIATARAEAMKNVLTGVTVVPEKAIFSLGKATGVLADFEENKQAA